MPGSRTRRGPDVLDDPQTDSSTAWAAAEGCMLQHDVDMVKDYAEDVDTLLVFAGLFSAVLTAFVIESYQLLQTDNAENTVKLLSRISTQLESFAFRDGYFNSTTSALPPPPPFEPDNSALTINILWFLSLIFSLAAALFGILVKQWLREYLRWHSKLASARENVMVRQVRFEAWNDWNMDATISCIPALLEVALVFFVCGLVVFVWSLDRFLVLFISVTVAIFLSIVTSFIVLPAIFKRCPYKSPTARLLAHFWDLVVDVVHYVVNTWRSRSAWPLDSGFLGWRLKHWRSVAPNWRARDLASICPSHLLDGEGKSHDALIVMRDEILAEWECSAVRGIIPVTVQEAYDALVITRRVPILLRALAWVSRASQNSRIQEQVVHCVESLHPPSPIPNPAGSHSIRNITIWQLLFNLLSWNEVLKKPTMKYSRKSRAVYTMRGFVQTLYSVSLMEVKDYNVPRYRLAPFWTQIPEFFQDYSSWEIQAVCRIVAGSFGSTISELLAEPEDGFWTAPYLFHGWRAMELLAVLRGLLSQTDAKPICIPALVHNYNAIYLSVHKDEFDFQFPGLRCSILEVACWSGCVTVAKDGTLAVLHRALGYKTQVANSEYFAGLAIKLGAECRSREDYHIFVRIAGRCLEQLVYSEVSSKTASALLDTMRNIIDRCFDENRPNCGCYDDLPWLTLGLNWGWNMTNRKITEKRLLGDAQNREKWQELMGSLERSIDAKLITGCDAEVRKVIQDVLADGLGGQVAPPGRRFVTGTIDITSETTSGWVIVGEITDPSSPPPPQPNSVHAQGPAASLEVAQNTGHNLQPSDESVETLVVQLSSPCKTETSPSLSSSSFGSDLEPKEESDESLE